MDPGSKEKLELIKKFIFALPKIERRRVAPSPYAGSWRPIDYQSSARKTFFVTSVMRTCPECEKAYFGVHPDNGCPMAAVEEVMEE